MEHVAKGEVEAVAGGEGSVEDGEGSAGRDEETQALVALGGLQDPGSDGGARGEGEPVQLAAEAKLEPGVAPGLDLAGDLAAQRQGEEGADLERGGEAGAGEEGSVARGQVLHGGDAVASVEEEVLAAEHGGREVDGGPGAPEGDLLTEDVASADAIDLEENGGGPGEPLLEGAELGDDLVVRGVEVGEGTGAAERLHPLPAGGEGGEVGEELGADSPTAGALVLAGEDALQLLDLARGGQEPDLAAPISGEAVGLRGGLEVLEVLQLPGQGGELPDGGGAWVGRAEDVKACPSVAGAELVGGVAELAGEAEGAGEGADAAGGVRVGVRSDQEDPEGLVVEALALVFERGGGEVAAIFEGTGPDGGSGGGGEAAPQARPERHEGSG
jgi:hypothetical protein